MFQNIWKPFNIHSERLAKFTQTELSTKRYGHSTRPISLAKLFSNKRTFHSIGNLNHHYSWSKLGSAEFHAKGPLNFTLPCHDNSCSISGYFHFSSIFLSKIRKTFSFGIDINTTISFKIEIFKVTGPNF